MSRLPTPPAVAGLSWRPATVDDAAAIAELYHACYEIDGEHLKAASEFRTELEDANNDPAHDSIVAVTGEGAIVVFGMVHAPAGDQTERRCFPWGTVHPAYRHRGIGRFLLEWQEIRGRQRLAASGDGVPRWIRLSAYDGQTDRIELFERFGYQRVRYFAEMIRDLGLPIPGGAVPEGVEIRVWSDELRAPSRLIHNASFADHWGSQPFSEYSWDHDFDEFFLPKASFMAFEAENPVAYLRSSAYPHEFESRGHSEGWIEGLGTLPSHRRRGIASALLIKAMEAYGQHGLSFAALGVDSESPTGAFGLYRGLGFEVEKTSINFQKPAF
jgi:mycothiol synthase